MTLLGSHAWWMPRWMEPVVPQLHLEGSPDAVAPPEPALASTASRLAEPPARQQPPARPDPDDTGRS
jgi:hypothetical protein